MNNPENYERRIMDFLRPRKWASRNSIVLGTGLARSTIYDAIQRLANRKQVSWKRFVRQRQVGRPKTMFFVVEK